jgi:cytochrome c-type biogenesis protein
VTLDASLASAFVAGLLSFLSPCILPLVPAYLAFLTGLDLSGGADDAPSSAAIRRAVARAFFFVLGFSVVFVALGATATTLGRLVGQWFDWLSIAAGLLVVAMGLHFLGLLRIPLLYREARFQTSGKPAGPLGAFVVGLAFAFGWTPCAGPVLATILMIAGAQDQAARGMLLLAAYSAGIGLPFLAAAFFVTPFRRFFARFKRFLGVVEKAMGALLVATGLLIMTGSMSLVANWMLETFPALGRIG